MKKLLAIWFCLFTLAAYSQEGNSHVQKGNEAYRNNDYKTAADEYQKALDKDPNNLAAKFNLGNVQLRMKNMADAGKQYDDVLSNAADTALKSKAFYNKGLALIKQQNLDEAIRAFKQALSLTPDDNDVRENLQKALNEKRQQQQQQNKQKNKEQPKKDQPKPQNQKPLNKQMMEQKFNELRNQEKQLQQKLQQKPLEGQPDKDW